MPTEEFVSAFLSALQQVPCLSEYLEECGVVRVRLCAEHQFYLIDFTYVPENYIPTTLTVTLRQTTLTLQEGATYFVLRLCINTSFTSIRGVEFKPFDGYDRLSRVDGNWVALPNAKYRSAGVYYDHEFDVVTPEPINLKTIIVESAVHDSMRWIPGIKLYRTGGVTIYQSWWAELPQWRRVNHKYYSIQFVESGELFMLVADHENCYLANADRVIMFNFIEQDSTLPRGEYNMIDQNNILSRAGDTVLELVDQLYFKKRNLTSGSRTKLATR